MTLARLQRDFSSFLRSDGSIVPPGIALSAERGLPVYHYAYRATLVAALRDVFERVHGWLGDARFDEAALDHIADYPPGSWTLADYGAQFDRTLARLYPDNPEVADLAWLDWSLRAAFNGPDAPPLDMAGLADVDWETARLRLAPTLVWREVTTNVAALWQSLSDAADDPPRAELLPAPVALTVWRDGLMPRFETLSPQEHSALLLALQGASFGQICAGLAAGDGDPQDAAALAATILQRWIAQSVLTGLY